MDKESNSITYSNSQVKFVHIIRSDFGFALDMLKSGRKVQRTIWHEIYIYKSGHMILESRFKGGPEFWMPSHADLLANDWQVINE